MWSGEGAAGGAVTRAALLERGGESGFIGGSFTFVCQRRAGERLVGQQRQRFAQIRDQRSACCNQRCAVDRQLRLDCVEPGRIGFGRFGDQAVAVA